MAVPIEPSGTPIDRHLEQLAQEQKVDEDGRKAVWGFVWTLFVFKVTTVVLIFYAASASGESFWLLVTTTWYWLAIPIAALMGPLAYQIRLRMVRRKRLQLQRAEWTLHEHDSESHTVTIITSHPHLGRDHGDD